jgi:hypothetical protein
VRTISSGLGGLYRLLKKASKDAANDENRRESGLIRQSMSISKSVFNAAMRLSGLFQAAV